MRFLHALWLELRGIRDDDETRESSRRHALETLLALPDPVSLPRRAFHITQRAKLAEAQQLKETLKLSYASLRTHDIGGDISTCAIKRDSRVRSFRRRAHA